MVKLPEDPHLRQCVSCGHVWDQYEEPTACPWCRSPDIVEPPNDDPDVMPPLNEWDG